MSWRSRPEAWSCAAVLLAAVPGPACAQGWRETQLAAVGAASRPAVGALGVGLAWRDPGRTRVGVLLMAGANENGGLAGRAEVAWHFLLDPAKRTGDGVYGGGGVALAASDGRTRPFILLVLGAENAPAGRRGTFIEVGVGGGVRLAVGMRWRKQNAPSR
jgi:hypothetical protein